MVEYLDKTGLSVFWEKIKDRITNTFGNALTISGGDIANIFALTNGEYNFSITNEAGTHNITTNLEVNAPTIKADTFVKNGGTSTQFLMADGNIYELNTLREDILTVYTLGLTLSNWGESNSSKSVKSWLQYIVDKTYTTTQIDTKLSEITNKLTSVLRWKGIKDTYNDIISITSAEIGDVWHNNADGKEYVATAKIDGTASAGSWEELGGTYDLSKYENAVKADTVTFTTPEGTKVTDLQFYNLKNTKYNLSIPVASALSTGVIRLYDPLSDAALGDEFTQLLVRSSDNVAYVDQKFKPTKANSSGSTAYPILFWNSTTDVKKLPEYYNNFVYNPVTAKLTISGTDSVSSTIQVDSIITKSNSAPKLGTGTVAKATQIMYLNAGVLTAGEELSAITTDYINSLS